MCIRGCLSRQPRFDGSLASTSFDGSLAFTAATAPVICLDAKQQRAGGGDKKERCETRREGTLETTRNAASTLPQPQVESMCKHLQGGKAGVASRQASCKQQRDQVAQRVYPTPPTPRLPSS